MSCNSPVLGLTACCYADQWQDFRLPTAPGRLYFRVTALLNFRRSASANCTLDCKWQILAAADDRQRLNMIRLMLCIINTRYRIPSVVVGELKLDISIFFAQEAQISQ